MTSQDIDMESINRHNAMIEKANARLETLWAAGISAQGKLGVDGVTITIERASFKGRDWVSRSYEVIPY